MRGCPKTVGAPFLWIVLRQIAEQLRQIRSSGIVECQRHKRYEGGAVALQEVHGRSSTDESLEEVTRIWGLRAANGSDSAGT